MDDKRKEAKINADRTETMSSPYICFSPILSIDKKDWENIFYVLLEFKEQIEKKIHVPIMVGVYDIFTETSLTKDLLETMRDEKIKVIINKANSKPVDNHQNLPYIPV